MGYKNLALRMLIEEKQQAQRVDADANPTHYENRLIADLGEILGLNKDDIRRANLDHHAKQRFPCLSRGEIRTCVRRCVALFDMHAFIDAFVTEVNSFDASTPPTAFARRFLDWTDAHLVDKHIVFDESSCSRVEVKEPLALAILEVLLLGAVDPEAASDASETYRGIPLAAILSRPEKLHEKEKTGGG